jgi:hypothetical protein
MFEASLCYVVSLRPVWATIVRPCLKKKQRKVSQMSQSLFIEQIAISHCFCDVLFIICRILTHLSVLFVSFLSFSTKEIVTC